MKTLSIVIPTYNTSRVYLHKCLNSLLCENSEDIEVIIVDDGSLEEYSTEIRKEVDSSPLEIQYYKKNNGGQNSAREKGLIHVTGKYVFFMDADDYVDAEALNRIILFLKTHNVDILAFNYDVCTPDGNVLHEYNYWSEKYERIDVHKGLLYSNSLWLQIYNKETLLYSGIHLVQGVKIGEDLASATAILATIGDEYATDECLYHYVKHQGSTLSNPPKESALDIIKAFDAMLEQLDEKTQDKYHEELEWLAILHVLYYNTERVLQSFDGNKNLIKQIRLWINEKYPNWKTNKYLKVEEITKSIQFVFIKYGWARVWYEIKKIKGKLNVIKNRFIHRQGNTIRKRE